MDLRAAVVDAASDEGHSDSFELQRCDGLGDESSVVGSSSALRGAEGKSAAP